jgi:hypothetical protein
VSVDQAAKTHDRPGTCVTIAVGSEVPLDAKRAGAA